MNLSIYSQGRLKKVSMTENAVITYYFSAEVNVISVINLNTPHLCKRIFSVIQQKQNGKSHDCRKKPWGVTGLQDIENIRKNGFDVEEIPLDYIHQVW
jgi:hypothetical protein